MKVNLTAPTDDPIDKLWAVSDSSVPTEWTTEPNVTPAPEQAPALDDFDQLLWWLNSEGEQAAPATETAPDATTEQTPAEITAPTEAKPEEAQLEDILNQVQQLVQESKDETVKAEQSIQESSIPDEEKQMLIDKLREKDQSLTEVQTAYKVLEQRLQEKISESENYKVDAMSNKKFIEKVDSDPDTQEFISLKIKADAWDEKSKARMEWFLKDQLSKMWYDLDSLMQGKKNREKMAMSQQPQSPLWISTWNNEEEWDALDRLKIS